MNRILLPPRYRTWSKDGWHIYFDPYNFVIVKVNDSGRLLLEMIAKYLSLKQIAELISTDFNMPGEKAEQVVTKFVTGLINAGFLHKNIYSAAPRANFPQVDFPYDIYLHLTNKCNLKCPYCYNKGDRETKLKLQRVGTIPPTMSTDEFKHLISQLVLYGVRRILFTGGEPLLRKDAIELLEFARSRSEQRVRDGGSAVSLEMLTNGTLITDQIAGKLCEVLDAVTISLDSHEQHLHEEQRGKHTFAPAVAGIRNLVAKKREIGGKKPFICVVPALTAKNVSAMKEIFEFVLDDLGADGLAPIIFQAGDHQQVSISQIPELEIYLREQARTERYMRARGAHRGTAVPKASLLVPRHHCGVGHHEISVDAAGFVYPCQSLHFDEFVCGNVRETDIKEIFESSPVMHQVRAATVEAIDACSHCDLKYLCNGGCRATAYNVYREFDCFNELYCRMLETTAVAKLWSAAENRVTV